MKDQTLCDYFTNRLTIGSIDESSRNSGRSVFDWQIGDKYKFTEVRYGTFRNFPYPSVFCFPIAKAGFIYLGEGDAVQCCKCKRKIMNWIDVKFMGAVGLTSNPSQQLERRHLSNNPICDKTGLGTNADQQRGGLCNIKTAEVKPKHADTVGLNEDTGHCEFLDVDKRRSTFPSFWPKHYPDIEQCAQSGFYYSPANNGCLQCAYCGIQTRLLSKSHDPVKEHARINPCCPHLPSIEIVNGEREIEEKAPRLSTSRLKREPFNSNMESKRNRRKSFEPPRKWTGTQRTEHLVDAGFFFCGVGDRVQCFHCGLMLEDWKEYDDPFVEHAVAFPACEFIRRSIGDTKLQKITRRSMQRGHDEAGRFHSSVGSMMDCTSVKTLLSMGFDGDSIRKALHIYAASSSTTDASTPNVTQLLDIITRNELPAKIPGGQDDAMSDERICMFCCSNKRDMVFAPCGHLISCSTCSKEMQKCPICRTQIEQYITVFYS